MKIIIATAAFLFSAGTLAGQELTLKDDTDVPAHIVMDFDQEYPGVLKEKWTLAEGVYEVDFIHANRDHTVRYLPDGTRMEKVEFLRRRELPEHVGESIGTAINSPYKVKSARRVEHEYFGNYYEVEVRSGREDLLLMVRNDGTFLQEPSTVYQE